MRKALLLLILTCFSNLARANWIILIRADQCETMIGFVVKKVGSSNLTLGL